MSETTGPTTIRHKIGTCPACRCGIWGEFDAVVDVGAPFMATSGALVVNTSPRFVGGRLEHRCAMSEDGEWTEPTEEEAR